MCRKNRWNRGEHCSLSLSLVPLCVLWEKDNTCYLRWSYKEKFRIKFFELWYVFAHQWTVYLLRKRKYAIPELRRFVLHLILFIFLLLLFFSRFCLTFPSRIVFFSSRREWSKRTNERWTRRFFTKIFIRATKEMGKACFIFFSNIVKRIMLSMLLCLMIRQVYYTRTFLLGISRLERFDRTSVQRYKFTMIIIIRKKRQFDVLFGEDKSEFLYMIILPRHFAPLFLPGIYTFRSFLKRVSTRRFGIFQVGPSNVRKMPGLPRRSSIRRARIRLHVWRENPRLISTRQKIWQWRKLPSPTEFHDSFSSLNSPANRNVACRPLSAQRKPRILFRVSFNSFDYILIKIIASISMDGN